MKQIMTDLWETAVESPFPGLTTHAYFLQREGGNVLFYNTGLAPEIEALHPLGGVAYQYLSHRDEMGDSLRLIREVYGPKLACHREEEGDCNPFCQPDILFERRERLLEDIEVIPTPGHSPGSTCFLVASASGQHYLFTGDTIYCAGDGQWRAGYIPGVTELSDVDTLAKSLRLLRELAPDVVLSSAFAGSAGYQAMAPDEWPEHVDRALEGLESVR